jgi:hypothetical protein
MFWKSKYMPTSIHQNVTLLICNAGDVSTISENLIVQGYFLFLQYNVVLTLLRGELGFRNDCIFLFLMFSTQQFVNTSFGFSGFLFRLDLLFDIFAKPSFLLSACGLIEQHSIMSKPHPHVLLRDTNSNTVSITTAQLIVVHKNAIVLNSSDIRKAYSNASNILFPLKSPLNVRGITIPNHNFAPCTQNLNFKV